jgi:hypothetical protein
VVVTAATGCRPEGPQQVATGLCRRALGYQVINAAPGTVGQARLLTIGTGVQPGRDAFPHFSDANTVAWCWTRKDGVLTAWVIRPDGKPVQFAIIGDTDHPATDPPAPGPPVIP